MSVFLLIFALKAGLLGTELFQEVVTRGGALQSSGVERVRELCERSRFFRALVRNCEVSLVRSDIDVASEYARLAEQSRTEFETRLSWDAWGRRVAELIEERIPGFRGRTISGTPHT